MSLSVHQKNTSRETPGKFISNLVSPCFLPFLCGCSVVIDWPAMTSEYVSEGLSSLRQSDILILRCCEYQSGKFGSICVTRCHQTFREWMDIIEGNVTFDSKWVEHFPTFPNSHGQLT